MSKYEYQFNFPENINIDLTSYKAVRVRYGTRVYKVDVEKFLEEFGTLVEIINDQEVVNIIATFFMPLLSAKLL